MIAARDGFSESDASATVLALALGEQDGASWRHAALAAVAELGLPDCWIGAGFVRSPVWDRLHGFAEATKLDDIDVVYFDPDRRPPECDAALEARLAALMPGLPWQVRNQARMHLANGDPPYRSTGDALAHWLETPTAVAVRLEPKGPALLSPLGLRDLLSLTIRPTPHAKARPERLAAYRHRLTTKNWRANWPKLRIEWD